MGEEDKATTESGGRHAVYDVTLQRYVGGVHPDKASADKARRELAKADDSHELESRRVAD